MKFLINFIVSMILFSAAFLVTVVSFSVMAAVLGPFIGVILLIMVVYGICKYLGKKKSK